MDANKADMDSYVSACHRLLVSMKANGFLPHFAIPVDPDGEILGGAHRLSCALALELPEVPITDEMRRVWAPAWGEAWFKENGCGTKDLDRIRSDWRALAVKSEDGVRNG